MAAPTYDQFFAKARDLHPNAPDAQIADAYQQKYGGAAVRTRGPSRDEFAQRARALHPSATDDQIGEAYQAKYGAGFVEETRRTLASQVLAPGARGLGAVLGGFDRLLGDVRGTGLFDRAGESLFQYGTDVAARNAPSAAMQARDWYEPQKLGQNVIGGLGQIGAAIATGGASLIPQVADDAGRLTTELEAEGMGPAEARARGTGYGLASAALERLGLSRLVPKRLPGRVLAGLQEGATEVVQGGARAAFGNEDPLAGMAESFGTEGVPAAIAAALLARGGRASTVRQANEDRAAQTMQELAVPGGQPAPAAATVSGAMTPPTTDTLEPDRTAQADDAPMQPPQERAASGVPGPTDEFVLRLQPEQQSVLRGLYQQAAEAQPQFVEGMEALASSIGGRAIARDVPLKEAKRATDKILGDYGGDATQIRDLLRATIEVDSTSSAAAAIQQITQNYEIVGRPRNLFDPSWTPIDGYRDAKFNVRLPNGLVAEVQVHLPVMMAAKDKAHGLYEGRSDLEREVARGGGDPSPRQLTRLASLNRQMRQIYSVAWEAANGNVSANAAGVSSVPLRSTEPMGNERSDPSGLTARIDAPPSAVGLMTTATPSTSNNPEPNAPRNTSLVTTALPPTAAIVAPTASRNLLSPHPVTTAAGRQLNVEPVVVEADDLLTSDRPGYPQELQPRARGDRAAMSAQVQTIAANLNPELLGYSAEADRGAPIVSPEGVVESGNGRVMALRILSPEKRAEYNAWLRSQGVDISGLRNPVLVRRRVTPLDGADRRAFTVEANQSSTAAMSATERAQADAAMLDQPALAMLQPGELTSAANAGFVRHFVGRLPVGERNAVLAADGSLSSDGIKRIQGALLAKAYGGTPASNATLSRILEAADSDVRSITGAMLDAAADFAQLRQSVADGVVPAELDTSAQLVQAVETVAGLRANQQPVAGWLSQVDMLNPRDPVVDSFVRAFYNRPLTRALGRDKIAPQLAFYAKQARAQRVDQGSLLDDAPASPIALLDQALAFFNPLETRSPKQAGLFAKNTERPKNPMLGMAVQVEVDRITRGWGRAAPQVIVVQTAADLPPKVLAALGPDINGAADLSDGTVYIVAQNMGGAWDVERILAHEAVGHYGMNRLMGDRWPWLLGQVSRLKERDPIVRRLAEDVLRKYGALDTDTEAAEIVAHLAERSPKHPLIARVLAMFREALRSMGFRINLSREDLVYLLNRAAARLNPSVWDGMATQSRRFAGHPVTKRHPAAYGAIESASRPDVFAARGGMNREKAVETPPPSGYAPAPGSPPSPGTERIQAGGGSYSLRQFANLDQQELATLTGVLVDLESAVEAQRRGTQTWDATEQRAMEMVQERFGVTLNSLVNRKAGSTANAEQIEAYGQLLGAAARQITEIAQRADITRSNQDLAALALARERLGLMLAPAMGYRSEAGRALAILRKTAADFERADKLMAALGDGSRELMADFAKRVADADNPDQVLGLVRESYRPDWWDKFYEYWINGLLSGPTTHAVNVFSNSLFNALELTTEGVASVWSRDVPAKALAARIGATLHGAMVGLANGKRAFLTEEPQLDPQSKLEQRAGRAIGGTAGKIIRLPSRALMAEDEFFKGVAYHQHLSDLVMREALRSNPADPRAEFHRLMGQVSDRKDLIDAAKVYADRATFQTPLGPIMSQVARALDKTRVLRLLVPFIRTPTNILKTVIEYSPAGVALEQVRANLAAGGHDQAMAYSRMAVGSSIMMGAVALTAQGILTGNGPDDENERRLWMTRGFQPYSLRVGDRWYRYNRFDPVGTLMGLAADFHELGQYMSDGEMSAAASLLMTSVALNLSDKTFLKGISDFAEAYSKPERYFANWMNGMLSSVVPSVFAQPARYLDPYQRDARTLLDQVRARIPFEREKVAARIGVTGAPIPSNAPFPGNPFQSSQMRPEPLVDAMLKLGVFKGTPSRSVQAGGMTYKLDSNEYAPYAEYIQKVRWAQLTPLVQSPQFRALMESSPIQAQELLEKLYDRLGTEARTQYLYRNPQLLSKLVSQPRPVAIGSRFVE